MVGVNKIFPPQKQVLKDIYLSFYYGANIGIIGLNGSGKSTLLKILAGVLPFEKGERVLGLNVESGYFSQHRWETLNAGRTVIQEAMATRRMNPDLLVRTVLGTFLFRDNAVFKKVEVLSGGEKSRLALAKLLLDPPNLLLLDEPTTHLDMASVEALVDALKDFEGTLCFISHDLYFVNALANHVAHVDQGRVRLFTGNHDDFLRLSAAHAGGSAPMSYAASAPVGGAPAWMKSSSDDLKRLREAEKARSKRRKKLNERIRELEAEIADIHRRMGSVFIQSDYVKLTELDVALKACSKEMADARAALQNEA